jgi:hypothetical protein
MRQGRGSRVAWLHGKGELQLLVGAGVDRFEEFRSVGANPVYRRRDGACLQWRDLDAGEEFTHRFLSVSPGSTQASIRSAGKVIGVRSWISLI